MKINNLTIKQEAFVQAYLKYGDASKAYREVYSCEKMKPKSVNELASTLLKNIKIASRVTELQAKAAKIAEQKFNITHEKMLRHLNILSQARIDEYVEYVDVEYPVTRKITTGTGKNKVTETITEVKVVTELKFKTFDKLTDDQKMCIESIKQNRYGEIELKLHGKEWTIKEINKHIGFYEKDNEQKAPVLLMTPEERDKRIEELKSKLK